MMKISINGYHCFNNAGIRHKPAVKVSFYRFKINAVGNIRFRLNQAGFYTGNYMLKVGPRGIPAAH